MLEESILCNAEIQQASQSNIIATMTFDDGTATFDDNPQSARGQVKILPVQFN